MVNPLREQAGNRLPISCRPVDCWAARSPGPPAVLDRLRTRNGETHRKESDCPQMTHEGRQGSRANPSKIRGSSSAVRLRHLRTNALPALDTSCGASKGSSCKERTSTVPIKKSTSSSSMSAPFVSSRTDPVEYWVRSSPHDQWPGWREEPTTSDRRTRRCAASRIGIRCRSPRAKLITWFRDRATTGSGSSRSKSPRKPLPERSPLEAERPRTRGVNRLPDP